MISNTMAKHYLKWLTDKINNDSSLAEEYCDTIGENEKEISDKQYNLLRNLKIKVELLT